MDKFLDIATYLLEVRRICNDQGKLADTKIAHYKTHLLKFVMIWKDFVTYKNPIFLKLHVAMCGAIAFMEKYGMWGRVNAQGFESYHYQHTRNKQVTGRIAQEKARLKKKIERDQQYFSTGVAQILFNWDKKMN